ncbi:Lipoprotein OutS [Dickeya dianthicola]|uniref:Lipoprotein, PulS/OutS family n=1 Tax=Dickeya dianthicola TaxID=204039 RepID=A0AAP6S0Y9_9GAMM|nr:MULTISPECIES: GspS family T2SS pilot lipoprotein variant OutS [Dickeya]ATO33983.1 Lipoprotein outS precursor [Dickeya dianthicola RNS04.9]AUH14254.1 pullulanase [Dickeya solani]AYC19935.1 Lipoprotein OutS [Dickeya dianthicola]MBI0438242.1 lipoprotein, PulS/OutS family [Dickeya dianthicola]MBI0448787.1 lipoprotein, PulS/OutS family [Dickeya dianthicola]
MHVFSLKVVLLGVCCLSLAACQTPAPVKNTASRSTASVPANEQISQLASLVAASKYLRVQCERSDLPDDGTILRTAVKVAAQKGWDTSRYQSLPQLSENLYQGLLKDGTPKATQCSSFNRAMTPFLDAMRTAR